MPFFVTTSLKASKKAVDLAKKASEHIKITYLPRKNMSLEDIEKNYSNDGILVVAEKRVTVYKKGKVFFFHPGMAKMRIKALAMGKTDYMIEAMGFRRGMKLLDCTLGVGSDATVASHVAGSVGTVVGLEINPLIAYVLKTEMGKYKNQSRVLTEAVRNVNVLNADHAEYLKNVPDNSFDVVYFDPMFKNPFYESHGISPLRELADYSPIRSEAIEEACRVAKCRVVMKERFDSSEFARLGFNDIIAARRSKIAYGVIIV